MTRRAKGDPAKLYICLESFGSADPDYGFCRKGAVLRGDHETVKRFPHYFVEHGIYSDTELERARVKLYPSAQEAIGA